ncbi:protein DEK [Nilaparvata lugens]|uniref:protein DEK n=1 Tax=Nilaparvata lugens TaxID=108931 RepID=UPI000B987A93|nr:protein DEK [Nilaparvata lugens]
MASKQSAKRAAAEKMAEIEKEMVSKKSNSGKTLRVAAIAPRSRVKSETESDSEQEIVVKKSGSKRQRATAAAAAAPSTSSANVAEKTTKKKTTKAEQAQSERKKVRVEPESDSDSGASTSRDKVPLLEQSLEIYAPRARKPVDQFDAVVLRQGSRQKFDVQITRGKGIKIEDIPSISYEVEKSGLDDLKTLHRIMYSRIGNVENVKDNIQNFSGFAFDKDTKPFRMTRTALTKLTMTKLRCLSQMLCLPKEGKIADYVERILQFLLKPTDTGLAARESRPERKGAHAKSYKEAASTDEAGPSRPKKRSTKAVETTPEGSAEEAEEEAKKPKKGKDTKKTKKVDEEDIKNGQEEVQAEDKTSKKTAKLPKKQIVYADIETPPSSSQPKETSGRKQNNSKKADEDLLKAAEIAEKQERIEKELREEEDRIEEMETDGETEVEEEVEMKKEPEQEEVPEPEVADKKNKVRGLPTDEELKVCIKAILDKANLEEITMKTLCQQVYEHYPGHDLSMKKDFIKYTVKSLIS